MNFDTIRKEVSGLIVLIALLYMDYAHIQDDPLKYLLMGVFGAIAGFGGYQGYKNIPGSPPAPQ